MSSKSEKVAGQLARQAALLEAILATMIENGRELVSVSYKLIDGEADAACLRRQLRVFEGCMNVCERMNARTDDDYSHN